MGTRLIIQHFPGIIGDTSILTVVDSVRANHICARLTIISAQRLVYLDINVNPVTVSLILHAAMLPNMQLRATQRMLEISQGICDVIWVKVMGVLMVGKENTVIILLGMDIWLASIAARPRRRGEVLGSDRECLVD